MKDSNTDLFDPRTVMDSDYAKSSNEENFGFAFNDSNFSDRVLRIEIMAEPSDSKSDCEGCSSIADWARHRKRRREDLKKDNGGVDVVAPDEQLLNQPFAGDVLACENDDEEAVAMIEESPSGDEAVNSNDSSWSMDCSTVRIKTLHISSPILAAKSPFFYKLFSNGMRESEQRHVTLRINSSEEASLMELLNFMYSSTLSATAAPALLDVLMAADKFEVASCMRYCSSLLRNMPMTPESALLYLDLPSSVLMAEAVQPLTDAAKQYLAERYKDITKFQEEVLNLPISGIEAILSSDDLQVASEDAVYDFVLKWARNQYPKLDNRREVLGSRLARYIRFPYMSCRKLRKVLSCPDFDHEVSSKLVLEALFFKAEAPHRQRSLAAEDSAVTSRRLVERAYKYRPVKVVEFELPRPQCVVYLDLKKEECTNLFPSGRVYSQAFHLGGQGFFLSAHCNMDQQSSFHCFGLFLGMQEKGSVSFAVDYEFAARIKPLEEFQSKYKGNYTFTGGKAVGYRNLFGIPWSTFSSNQQKPSRPPLTMTADAQKIETLEIPDIHYPGKPILIKPDRPTPNHSLYLSNLDDQKFLRFSIKYLYAYEKAVCVNTLKDSLSKVLSEYYPLAGRLKISEEDEQKFSVDCNGEGAVFAEAFMDSYSVYDLLELCKKPNKSFRKLLFKIDAHTFLDVPPLVVQVTYLRYGGMIISTAFNHCLCDGIGTSQFLNDWAYMTTKPNSSLPVTPFHTRHHLKPRCPPINLTTQPPPTFTKSTPSHQGNQVTINNISQFLQSQGLVATSITFEPSHILRLKSQCSPSLKCTTFEALASHTWRAWVRALNLSHWLNVKLLFSINIRKKMKPELTQGYYGNGFVLGCAETNVRDLVNKNLHHGVKVVQNAKSMVDDEYVRSVIDLLEDKSIKTDMSLSLIISQWSKFGLEDADFGEGKPLHMGPLTSDVYCLFLPVPGNFDAIRVLVSLPQSMASKFEFHMTDGIWDSVENVDQAN